MSEHRYITPVDLLASLFFDNDSRAQTIFKLREHFPLYYGCPSKLASMPAVEKGLALSNDSKMILAWAAIEAGRLEDYWLDTEHLLLGIMRARPCAAASYLERTGLTLKTMRKSIQENRSSRPDYGPVSRWWPMKVRFAKLTLGTWTP